MTNTTYCPFCAATITKGQTQCEYEGLCAAGLTGKEITTIPKHGFTDPSIAEQKANRVIFAREKYNTKIKPVPIPKIKAVAFDIYGQKIATYESIRKCSEALSVGYEVIKPHVLNRRKNGITESGYAFRAIDAKPRACTIIVKLVDGKEEGRWPTCAQAARANGLLPKLVYDHCEGTNRNRFKQNWRFAYKTITI